MGSAVLNQTPADDTGGETPVSAQPAGLREHIVARLAAHRVRRPLTGTAQAEAFTHPVAQPDDPRKARVAAAVAERYAHAQSYRAFLAAEAERAVQQARAAAEIAARNAAAVVEAQQQLLDTLAREAAEQASAQRLSVPEEPAAPMLWPELATDAPAAEERPRTARAQEPRAARSRREALLQPPAPQAQNPASSAGTPLRVVLYEEIPSLAREHPIDGPSRPSAATQMRTTRREAMQQLAALDPDEARLLDEEISFRQSPVFEEPAGPPTTIAANLIEFPRQLVASRKARPRLAEGPLRDEDVPVSEGSQLRIFEVEPEQICTIPQAAPTEETSQAQWASIWLEGPGSDGASAEEARGASAPLPALAPVQLHPAALSRRALAGCIDLALLLAGAGVFAAAFAAAVGHMASPSAGWGAAELLQSAAESASGTTLQAGAGAAVAVLASLAAAYQLLCFAFSDATPGMRFARIGLCTFTDENPTRGAIRMRLFALAFSVLTLGLGLGWALVDEDRLTWHDLLSRMYQRSY